MTIPLFAPDRFSGSRPQFGATTKFSENIVRQIVDDNFGSLGRPDEIQQIAGLSIEQAESIEANACNFRFRCGSGDYVFKYVLRQDIIGDLERQLAMCEWLWKQGLPVAKPIKADDGSRMIAAGEARAYVLQFVEGHYFAGEDLEIEPAGRALGALMAALGKTPDELSLRRSRPPYFTTEEYATLSRLRDGRRFWETDFGGRNAEILKATWDVVESGFEEINARADALNDLPRQLTHFDVHPHNLLMKDGEVNAILDLDACYQLPVELGVGFATAKLMKRVGTARLANARPASLADDAKRFLDAVARDVPSIADDSARLESFATAETLRRLLSVCRKHLDGRQISWHGISVHAPALLEIGQIFK